MDLVEYPDREMLMLDLADKLAGELNSCLQRHEHASFSVPGGSTRATDLALRNPTTPAERSQP